MMVAAPAAWKRLDCQTGLRLKVRVTPGASCDAIEGLAQTAEGPALKVRLRAIAEHGRANAALTTLVATWLLLPKTAVKLDKGGKSRLKSLQLFGDPDMLEALLDSRIAGLGAG